MIGVTLTSRCSCGGTMLVRTVRATGDRFLGCVRFPTCRRTAPYLDALAELARERDELERRAFVAEANFRRLSRELDRLLEAAEAERESLRVELRRLLVAWHPDRGSTLDSTSVCQRISALRDRLAREIAA